MEDKILTIVVPCYNVEEFVDECLDSLAKAQVIDSLEVLVVNDGSKDNTLNLAQKYSVKYPSTFFIIDKKNGGHGSTINVGIKNATGKYFMVLDGDDWLNSKELDQLVYRLSNVDVDLVSFNYTRVENGLKNVVKNNEKYIQYEKIYFFDKLKLKKMYFVLSSICYKTQILRECNLTLFENMFYVDLQYIIKPIVAVDSIIFYDLNIYNYRLGNINQSVNINNMLARYEQHETVVNDLILFYNIQSAISKEKEKYIRNIILKAIYTQYHLSLTYDPDLERAERNAQRFDQFLKENNNIFYKKISSRIFMLAKARKTKFNILKYRNSLAMKLKNYIRTVCKES